MDADAPAPAGNRLQRTALAAVMALVAVNVWTGGPLFALWVGSRVQSDGGATMLGVFAVIGAVAAISFALLRVLEWLGRRYDRLAGTSSTVRVHAPWLRSMRGERELYPGERVQLTMLERVLVVTVVVAALAFEIWFFFYSASPIDQRSGRGSAPTPAYAHTAARLATRPRYRGRVDHVEVAALHAAEGVQGVVVPPA
jgi:predicted secreted protein